MTCTLLATPAEALEVIDNAWEVRAGSLLYLEEDRVNVTKIIVSAGGKISDTDSVKLKTIYDSMSGGTPSGAVNNSTITFTGASGGVSVSGQARALASFTDARLAQSLQWDHQLDRLESMTFTASLSVENDYRSFGGSAVYNIELENKRHKLTFGVSGTYDEVFRTGGNNTPIKLSRVTDGSFAEEGKKTALEALAGFTTVINKRTLAQFNLGVSKSQGYLTDPYKLISIVDDINGVEYDQFYESRPDSRLRYTIAMAINHQVYPTDEVFHGAYRFYTDDWGVSSHTFDVSMEYPRGERTYLKPNFRLYLQQQADFYRNSFAYSPTAIIPVEQALPDHLSADYRLDGYTSYSLGVTYGQRTDTNSHLRARAMISQWFYDNATFDKLNALTLDVNYTKKF